MEKISEDKVVIRDVEKAIIQQSGNYVFIDDMHKLDVNSIKFLKAIKDRSTIIGNYRTTERLKDDMNQLLWGVYKICINPLNRKDTIRLSELAVVHFGCTVPKEQIVNAAHGLPGRIHSFCSTGEIPRDDSRMKSEEFNIAPIFFLGFVVLILFRYIGRATGATDLVMIGGFAMVLGIVGRSIFLMGSR